jgi:2-polyprenyl-3-methyl-5-hydroxy-6-metoxy-1,4-benzoquinol methylase
MEPTKTIYDALNHSVLSFVPSSASRILDVGCGTGVFGESLRENRERYVAGITYSDQEAALASKRLSQVYCANLADFDFTSLGKFDCVVLSHILEHLYSPEDLLKRIKSVLDPESLVIVALPNVLWWKQRLAFLMGRWRYRDWGVLDRTHYRFFDLHSSAQLLEDAGYEIIRRKYDGLFPLTKPIRALIGATSQNIDRVASKLLPGLFADQFIYLTRVKK